MDEEITRAAAGTSSRKTSTASSAAKRKTTSSGTSGRKTSTASTAKKKTSSASSSGRKTSTSTAKKKTSTTSTSIRLTAAEKKLITNYRKCGTLQKQIIALIVEKVAGGLTKLDGIERAINMDEVQ